MVSIVDGDNQQRKRMVHLRMMMLVLIPWMLSFVGYLMMTMMMMMIARIQLLVYDVSVSVSAADDDIVVQWQQVCPAPVPSEHSPGTCGSSLSLSLD